VRRDQTSFGDGALVSAQNLDGLGRPVTSIVVENSANWAQQSLTDVTYNALGLTASNDSPWRSGNQPGYPQLGPNWTTYSYDGLGRLTQRTNPDGSIATTTYAGNTTTVKDEALHAKTITTDGLGRITQVVEDPGGLNITTSYSWWPTGKLRGVTQGGQVRSYQYDTAGRLTVTVQPESGAVVYQYDQASNVASATDSRNYVKNYSYDALNRLTKITYSDGTPTVTYAYDTATNGKGRLQSVSNGNSTTQYTAYDPLGRVLQSIQTTGGTPYTFSYTYNLAGALKTETYPDGRVLTTN